MPIQAETLLPLGKLDPGLREPDAPLAVDQITSQAKLTDELGYHSLLMEETKDDPFQVLALAAQCTQRVKIGTSVAIAFARSPFVAAQAAWTAQKISAGRFELGLGSQVRGHIKRRYGLDWHPAGPWMRDYVNAVRAIWTSWQQQTPLDFKSDHYQLNLNVPLFTPAPINHPDIPILVAAVNPYMCQVAAEVADGVRLHPVCTPRYIREILQPRVLAVRPNAHRDFEVCLKPLIATAVDEATLAARKEIARQRLAFYLSTPAYAGAFTLFGLEDLCAELSGLSKQGRWNEMADKITDDWLHEWVVVARYDELAAAIRSRFDGLIQRIEVSIPITNSTDADTLQAIVSDLNQ